VPDEVAALHEYLARLDAGAAPDEPAPPGGKVLYELKCTNCHAVGGFGGRVGPELAGVGSRRDRGWMRTQILDPKRHNPETKMTPFAGRVSGDDLEALLDYLEALP